MITRNNKSKTDKVGIAIFSAFLLLTGTHLGCRYDLGAAVDSLFQKVSAETVNATAVGPDPLTQAPVVIPPSIVEDKSPATPTIARNPFLVPAGARPMPVVANAKGGINHLTGGAAPVAVGPRVKGVVRSNGQSLAIIEYKGKSSTYTAGASIGDGYSVSSISGKSVSINGNSTNLGGRS